MVLAFTDPLERVIAGNAVATWLQAAGVAAGVLAGLLVLRRLVVARLAALAEQTETTLDDFLVELVRRTRWFFLLALGVLAGMGSLALRAKVETWMHRGIVLALIAQGALWGNVVIGYWLDEWLVKGKQEKANSAAVGALRMALRIALGTVLLLVGLDNLGVNITALVTGLGVGGIAVALAVQNILGDLLAALSIVLDKPFEVGDAVQVDAFEGTVERVGLKTTRVRSVDGEQIIFANAELLKSRIRNLSRRAERRVVLVHTLDVDAAAPALDAFTQRARAVVQAQPGARFERSVLRGATPEGLEVETVYVIGSADFAQHVQVRHQVMLGLHQALADLQVGYASSDHTAAGRALRRRERPQPVPGH